MHQYTELTEDQKKSLKEEYGDIPYAEMIEKRNAPRRTIIRNGEQIRMNDLEIGDTFQFIQTPITKNDPNEARVEERLWVARSKAFPSIGSNGITWTVYSEEVKEDKEE